jgi:hypothetical protein
MRQTVRILLYVVVVPAIVGCTSVKPYQKEHLADPIMMSVDDDVQGMRELKWLEAREGSTGGVGGLGGGCGCK